MLLSLAAVHCQDEGETPDFDELMTELDGDKDGKISWDEMFGGEADDMEEMPEDIKQQYKSVYQECDANADGLIDRQELPTLFDKLSALEDAEEEREDGSEEI